MKTNIFIRLRQNTPPAKTAGGDENGDGRILRSLSTPKWRGVGGSNSTDTPSRCHIGTAGRFIILILVFITSCTSLSSGRLQTETLNSREALSEEAVVLAVPIIYQKEKHECGLTSINMLLTYYGIRFDDQSSIKFNQELELQNKENRAGISAALLKKYLLTKECDVYIFPGTLDDSPTGIFHHIGKGRPLVVMIASGRDRRHYVLVIGYDKPNKKIVIQDPVRGALLLPEWQFNDLWEKCKNFTLLATPKVEGAQKH